jgi:hypothetical protein
MSDVEYRFKAKLRSLVRKPHVTHNEQIDEIKPYMGNPFTAPGTLGLRSIYKQQSKVQEAKQRSTSKQPPAQSPTIATESDESLRMESLSTVSEESNFIKDTVQYSIDKAAKERTKQVESQSQALETFKPLSTSQLKDLFLNLQDLVEKPSSKLSKENQRTVDKCKS